MCRRFWSTAAFPTAHSPPGKSAAYLAEALFENLALVIAQSELDAYRFRELGARPVVVSGNLKVDTSAAARRRGGGRKAACMGRRAQNLGGDFHA